MKSLFSLLILTIALPLQSQVFEKGKIQMLVKRGADHVYNSNLDSANYYANQVEKYIPDHPVVPMIRALALLWIHIPTISPEAFSQMQKKLDSVIFLAEQKDPQMNDPEMIFFAMSAHGLLAEYYAEENYTMKTVTEASKAYSLMKKGFDLVEEYPEFLFITGIYNYFREKYPEKHPIYKPLLWFFRSGDKELGITQLKMSIERAFLTKVESYVYLSYIYLRYEFEPEKAQRYLAEVCAMYPNNFYVKAKYIESLANPRDFAKVSVPMIYSLINQKNDYYKLAGYVFLGYYQEMILKNRTEAEYAYRQGIKYGMDLPDNGEYFKSFGYLGLGRILIDQKKIQEAKEMLSLALKYAETEQVEKEAKELLAKIE